MPSVSKSQQHFMGAAYARKEAGHPAPGDPKMSTADLRDFAATKTSNLPERKAKRGSYGRAFS